MRKPKPSKKNPYPFDFVLLSSHIHLDANHSMYAFIESCGDVSIKKDGDDSAIVLCFSDEDDCEEVFGVEFLPYRFILDQKTDCICDIVFFMCEQPLDEKNQWLVKQQYDHDCGRYFTFVDMMTEELATMVKMKFDGRLFDCEILG